MNIIPLQDDKVDLLSHYYDNKDLLHAFYFNRDIDGSFSYDAFLKFASDEVGKCEAEKIWRVLTVNGVIVKNHNGENIFPRIVMREIESDIPFLWRLLRRYWKYISVVFGISAAIYLMIMIPTFIVIFTIIGCLILSWFLFTV
jgi:hypothetical protein